MPSNPQMCVITSPPVGGGRGIVISLSVCLFVCLSVCLFVCVSVCTNQFFFRCAESTQMACTTTAYTHMRSESKFFSQKNIFWTKKKQKTFLTKNTKTSLLTKNFTFDQKHTKSFLTKNTKTSQKHKNFTFDQKHKNFTFDQKHKNFTFDKKLNF